jgi:peptide/nickel transport system substrate-binding protein
VDRAYSYIGWNQRRPFFTDRRVRLALGHCFHRERMIKEAYHGLGRPIDSCVHPDTAHANTALKPVQFDLVQASRLLDEAGWTDSDKDGIRDMVINGEKKSFRFTLLRPAHAPTWDRVSEIFMEDLAKVGIKMDSKALEWPELLKIYESKDFEATTGGWQMGLEPDFMQIWHSSEADKPGSSNKIGFKNAKADELILKLRRTFDPAERIRICQDFQAIIAEEQPYTFFRVVENVLIWQAKGSNQRQALSGITTGLDTFHPLVNHDITSAAFWFLPR